MRDQRKRDDKNGRRKLLQSRNLKVLNSQCLRLGTRSCIRTRIRAWGTRGYRKTLSENPRRRWKKRESEEFVMNVERQTRFITRTGAEYHRSWEKWKMVVNVVCKKARRGGGTDVIDYFGLNYDYTIGTTTRRIFFRLPRAIPKPA